MKIYFTSVIVLAAILVGKSAGQSIGHLQGQHNVDAVTDMEGDNKEALAVSGLRKPGMAASDLEAEEAGCKKNNLKLNQTGCWKRPWTRNTKCCEGKCFEYKSGGRVCLNCGAEGMKCDGNYGCCSGLECNRSFGCTEDYCLKPKE